MLNSLTIGYLQLVFCNTATGQANYPKEVKKYSFLASVLQFIMEPLRNLNSSEEKTNIVCYNMNMDYFRTGDFLGWYIANCVVSTALAIVATMANLCILITIWRTSHLHTPSNILLFCLAVSDLGVGLLTQPLAVINTVAKIRGIISTACVTGAAAAVLSTYLCGVSLLSVTAVSVDRYLALYLHLRYKQLVTNKRVIALLVYTWLFVALVLLMWLWHPWLILGAGIAVGSICILITSGCFFRIYLILRYHFSQIRSQTRHKIENQASNEALINSTHYRKSVLGMFMVYVVLLFCYLPYLSVACVVVVQDINTTNRLLFELTRTLVYANSAINPFIYCWRLHDIRTAVMQRLRCV